MSWPRRTTRPRPGETVRPRLGSWADLAGRFTAINRSEREEKPLLLTEPAGRE